MALSNCVSYGSDVFPCHARRTDESRILNDLHRITQNHGKSSRELKVLVRSIN
ncbi:hypothetical protein T08_11838, partial [Trichinella sp. T8]